MSHARLYIAPTLEAAGLSEELMVQSADIEHFVKDNFGIADARELQARAARRPVTRKLREFVVHFASITTEAQNALLKLLEEPPEAVVFHIVVAREDVLLPTVRSRLLIVSQSATYIYETSEFADFAALSPGERMSEIAARTKAKDTAWMEAVLSGAEVSALEKPADASSAFAASVLFVRQYFGSRGASNKMLLEELALSL